MYKLMLYYTKSQKSILLLILILKQTTYTNSYNRNTHLSSTNHQYSSNLQNFVGSLFQILHQITIPLHQTSQYSYYSSLKRELSTNIGIPNLYTYYHKLFLLIIFITINLQQNRRMGEVCSSCNTKANNKTEISHHILKKKVDNQILTSKNTDKEIMSELLSNNSYKRGKKSRQSNAEIQLQLRYTTSFEAHPENTLSEEFRTSSNILIKDPEKSSANTLVLKEMNDKYLNELFESAQKQALQEIEIKQQKIQQLQIPQESTQECQLKRTISNKSNNNKIDRQLFIRISKQNINQKYVYNTKIGEGGFGFVYKGYDKHTKEERAIKIIKKRRLTQKGGQQALFAELEILREIDHPNIIKLYDVIEYRNIFYIVTEYCDGGQLFEAVRCAKYFTEGHVAHIMRQVLSAVSYLEKKGIVHRDLKPQNIVLQFKSTSDSLKEPPIKIIDFGTATYCRPGQILKTQVGSPYYIAPQVIKQQYNTKCDIWSCGVIMYVLLCGYPPFRGRAQKDIFESILKGKLVMEGPIWSKISEQAKDLLRQMLEPNPLKRFSAQQALKHKWMTQFSMTNIIQPEVLSNMQKFFFKNKFLAVIETFLAMKTLSQQDRRSLTDKFKEMDKDNSGVLQVQQVIQAYKSIYGDTDESDIKRIIQNIDTDHSGNIELTEFIVATIQHQKLFKKQALQNAWNFFDKDKTGYLDLQELGLIVGDSTTDQLRQIMRELGAQGQQISKRRFMKVFQSKYHA